MSTLAADVKRQTPVEVSLSGVFRSLSLMFVGCVLCLAALVFLLAGGADGMPGGALSKLWLSVLMAVAGSALLYVAKPRKTAV